MLFQPATYYASHTAFSKEHPSSIHEISQTNEPRYTEDGKIIGFTEITTCLQCGDQIIHINTGGFFNDPR